MNKKAFTLIELLVVVWFVVIAICGAGWCMNLYKITKLDFKSPYKAEIIRGVGIFVPISFVTGYMNIGEENNK